MEKIRTLVPEDEEKKIDLYTYWKIFWRKKFYLIVPLVFAAAIVFVGSGHITPVYESYTVLSVEDQNILSRTMGRYVTTVEERDRVLNQQYRAMIETKLMSRSFLELIVKELNLQNAYQARRELEGARKPTEGLSAEEFVLRRLVSLLRDKIKISSAVPGYFRISVRDTDPETAYVLARTIGEEYIDVVKQEQVTGLRQAGAFSDEQLTIYKEKLEASEKELARLRREMTDTEAESNPVNGSNVHTAEARARTISARIGSTEDALSRVRERLKSIFDLIPSTERIAADETAQNLENQIYSIGEERLLEEIRTEAETLPEDARLTGLWDELRRRVSAIVDEEYEEFSPDVRPLITEYFMQRYELGYHGFRERKLRGYIDQYRQNVERRPLQERELSRITHDVETNRAVYQAFLESKTSAQISEAVQSTNLGVRFGIVEKAERPFVPVEPNKLKIILLSLLFGLASGVGAILITEYLDDSFRTIDEVERILKIPVLGTVPKTVSHFTWEKKKRGRMILLWIAGLFVFVSIVSGALYLYARSLKATSIGIELHEKNQ